MSETQTAKPPIWYWIIGAIALIWNALGVMAYLAQVTISKEAIAALPQAQQDLFSATPSWVMVAFAIAVFGGALGAIALLLRKSWAFILFAVSLLGVLSQMSYQFFLSNTFEVMGNSAKVMPVMIIVVAIFLVWFAHFATKKSWVR